MEARGQWSLKAMRTNHFTYQNVHDGRLGLKAVTFIIHLNGGFQCLNYKFLKKRPIYFGKVHDIEACKLKFSA